MNKNGNGNGTAHKGVVYCASIEAGKIHGFMVSCDYLRKVSKPVKSGEKGLSEITYEGPPGRLFEDLDARFKVYARR